LSTLIFCLKDGLAGLARSRLSAAITISTISISLFLIGVFYVLSTNFVDLIAEFRKKVMVEVYLFEDVSNDAIYNLHATLRQLEEVDSVRFISKADALDLFRKTYEDKYEDVLESNPLPASFQIFLQQKYMNPESAKKFESKMYKHSAVEDVLYRKGVIARLDRYSVSINIALIVSSIGLGLLSLILVANNIKLTLYAKRRIVETMELVGATRLIIKGPFFLQAMIEGGLGGFIASFFLFSALKIAQLMIGTQTIIVEHTMHGGLVLLGILYGTLGCAIAFQGKPIYRNLA